MKIKILLALAMCLMMCVSTVGCSSADNDTSEYEKIYVSASWSYNYSDVEELTSSADLIAIVSIEGIDDSYENGDVMMSLFSAQPTKVFYGNNADEIKIVMTGGIDNENKVIYEVEDDPLMETGEKYLIFAQKNENDTYTILSGSQGRFVIDDGKIYSLNVANEQVKKSNVGSNIKINGENKKEFFNDIKNTLEKSAS